MHSSMNRTPSATLPGGVRFGYAAGSLATGVFATVPGLVLLPYLTDTFAVPAALAGALVLVPKAWDVICNVLAGRISDRSRHRWGPRRPFLLYGGVGLAVTFALMFAHPGGSDAFGTAWVVLWFLAAATAFAFFQVPYIAMAAEITQDPAERTRLMTRRIAVLALAILAGGAGAPAIRDAVAGPAGYRWMGVAMGVLVLVGALWCFRATAAAPVGTVRPSVVGTRAMIAAVKEADDFRRLWVIYLLQAVGIGTMLAGVDYVARVVLDRPGFSAVLFVAFIGPALLLMPLWQYLAGRLDKVRCYLLASVLFTVAAAVLAFAGGSVVLTLVCGVLAGIGYAGLQVFPLALLPDVTSEAEQRTGSRRAGVFAGVWTGGEALAMALGPGIYGVVLAVGGYVSGAQAQDQPDSAALASSLGFGLVPALAVALTVPLLLRLAKKLPVTHEGRP